MERVSAVEGGYYLPLKTINMTNAKTEQNQKQYVGTYKVVKVFRISARKKILERGLTLDEAKRVVKRFPNSTRSMVFFTQQHRSEKYYK